MHFHLSMLGRILNSECCNTLILCLSTGSKFLHTMQCVLHIKDYWLTSDLYLLLCKMPLHYLKEFWYKLTSGGKAQDLQIKLFFCLFVCLFFCLFGFFYYFFIDTVYVIIYSFTPSISSYHVSLLTTAVILETTCHC